MVRMANLSIIGSHSPMVSPNSTRAAKERMFPEFAVIYPDRFNNQTNGITQRRWCLTQPPLANLISDAIGDKWITDYSRINDLTPFAEDATFRKTFLDIKRKAKVEASNFLKRDCAVTVDPDSLFDVQIKRIHEYKRQLLNALNIVLIYQRLKEGTLTDFPATTFLFGGKAAPGYVNAKLIIKFINNIAQTVNADSSSEDLKVHFLPNYRVTMAEKIIPASDLSEQISTAGFEASGTAT